jgi:hypothetical protein
LAFETVSPLTSLAQQLLCDGIEVGELRVDDAKHLLALILDALLNRLAPWL